MGLSGRTAWGCHNKGLWELISERLSDLLKLAQL